MDKPKSIYICIPMPVFCEPTQRERANYWTKKFEGFGCLVINPFELRDKLEKTYHVIAKCDPMEQDYRKERNANIEFCDFMFLCNGWENDAECMNDVDEGIKHGLKFMFQGKAI